MNKLWRAQKQLTQELGREPTPEELADEMHMPVSRIHGAAQDGAATGFRSMRRLVTTRVSVGDFIEEQDG